MREWKCFQTYPECSLNNIFQKQTIPDLARWQIFHWVGGMPRLLLHISCYCCWGVCTGLKSWMKILGQGWYLMAAAWGRGWAGVVCKRVSWGCSRVWNMSQCQTAECVCVRAAECKRGTGSTWDFSALLSSRGKWGLPNAGLLSSASAPADFTLHLGVPGILLLPAHFHSFLLSLFVFLVILIITGRQQHNWVTIFW